LADDYLQPDMTPKQSRDGYKMRTGKGSMAGPADTAIGYGRGWATVSNTPFREYKHWVHEGGISTPLIVHWPEKVTRQGELEATPSHLIDLMATAVDISGATYPSPIFGKPLEGKSLVPVFLGKSLEREAIYWEHEGNRAVRAGDYKLVAKGAKGAWELYNIAKDRSEQNNLAASQGEQTQKLASMWQAYAERANVLPLNPGSTKNRDHNKNNKKASRRPQRLELQPDANLNGDDAPYVQDRRITVEADAVIAGDGVIAAQGGTEHGWALYVQKGKVCFATTTGGKRNVIRGSNMIAGQAKVKATLAKDGKAQIVVNGREAASGRFPGVLISQPADGLQVSRDMNGNVGEYRVPFALDGHVTKVILQID
jgi:arylsulfatase